MPTAMARRTGDSAAPNGPQIARGRFTEPSLCCHLGENLVWSNQAMEQSKSVRRKLTDEHLSQIARELVPRLTRFADRAAMLLRSDEEPKIDQQPAA